MSTLRSSQWLMLGGCITIAACSQALNASRSPYTPSVKSAPGMPSAFMAHEQTSARFDVKKPYVSLKAAKVAVTEVECNPSGLAGVATFSANGAAKGRVHGNFAATGEWNFVIESGKTLWYFSEKFEIKGKHPKDGTVTGNGTGAIATCKQFGPVGGGSDLGYHLGKKTGSATTTLLKDGGSFLQRLR
jgi:hypothetical protein